MALWWAVYAAGIAVLVGSVFGSTRANPDRRIAPLWRNREPMPRQPIGSHAAILVGTGLWIVGAGKATQTDAGWYALVAVGLVVTLFGQFVIVRAHNRSVADLSQDAGRSAAQ